MFLHIISARYANGYRIKIKFNDDREGVADLSESLTGKVFKPLQDLDLFQQFEVDTELGTLRWINDADFAPEYLYFLAFRDVVELQEKFQKWGYLASKVVALIPHN
jgi:hypothetical protein